MDLTLPEIGTATGTWSVTAVVHTTDGAIILAEQYKRDALVLDYVVAFVPLVNASGDYQGEWRSGRYFRGPNTRENRQQAQAAFTERIVKHFTS